VDFFLTAAAQKTSHSNQAVEDNNQFFYRHIKPRLNKPKPKKSGIRNMDAAVFKAIRQGRTGRVLAVSKLQCQNPAWMPDFDPYHEKKLER
jgi:hypothetical protein